MRDLREIEFRNHTYQVEDVLEHLPTFLTEERKERINTVLNHRSLHIVPVLENVFDTGNINAVLRSAENFGIQRVDLLLPKHLKHNPRVTQGAHKWLDINKYRDYDQCYNNLKKEGYKIVATALTDDAIDLDQVDFTQKSAVIFGNEHEGVCEKTLKNADIICKIPTVGFTESFNISVAAAITLHHIRSKIKNNHPLKSDELKYYQADYILKSVSMAREIMKRLS